MKRKVSAWIGAASHFFRKGVWEFHGADATRTRRAAIRAAQLAVMIVRGFRQTQCSLHAASLTFFSLLSLVPVLALTLVMARAFGGAELAKRQINRRLDGWMAQVEAAARPAAPKAAAGDAGAAGGDAGAGGGALPGDAAADPSAAARAFVKQVRATADKLMGQVDRLDFGTLGGVGAVMLLWTVIGVLGKVEDSFNKVWGVDRPRSLYRKTSDYLCTILILPFLMVAASTIPVAARITRFMDATVGGEVSTAVKTLLESGLFKTSVTLLLSALTFAFLLGFMPNTRVKALPALAGGLVTAVLFSWWFRVCAWLQVGIARYSALYGGFAALPILLMWVYTSWQIVLLGSETAFAIQNRETYQMEGLAGRASLRARFLLALAFCAEAAGRARGKAGGPFAAQEFAQARGLPHRLVRDMLDGLTRNKILAEIADEPGSYLLYRCGGSLTVADLLLGLVDEGIPPGALGLRGLDAPVWELNGRLDEALKAAFGQSISSVGARPQPGPGPARA